MGDEEADVPTELPTLQEGELKDKVMALYTVFDIKSDGKIPLQMLRDARVTVGPSSEGVLSSLADMDFNGDGYIEKHEWEQFFAFVASEMGADMMSGIMANLDENGR